MIVRASLVLLAALEAGPARGGDAPCGETKLLAPDGEAADRFGASVAIDADVALVGVYGDDDNGQDAGAAWVFRVSDDAWSPEQKLIAEVGEAGSEFGSSVSVEGPVAVVGALAADDLGQDSGAAHVFRWNGAAWLHEQKLLPSDGAAFDWFGHSVWVSGDLIIVGAPRHDENGSNAGAAYVFRWDGSSWTQEEKLLPAEVSSGDEFGTSVSIEAEVAVVGAPDHGAGAAWVFRWNAAWEQEDVLGAGDGAPGDEFGRAVSLAGDTAIVGAPSDDDGGLFDSGAAYVFRQQGSSWTQEQKLAAADAQPAQQFGFSVAISAGAVVVGAPGPPPLAPGSAYFFRRIGSSWEQEAKAVAPDGWGGETLGGSVSIRGDRAVVGAHRDDDHGSDSGSAFVYDLECGPPCPADVSGDGEVGVTDLTFVILAWGQAGGAADVNGDGIVDVLDLVEVITNWGPCA